MLLINRLRICLSVNRRCEPLGYERTHVITSGVMGPKSGPPFIFFCSRLFSYRVSLAIGHSSHFGSLLQFRLQAAGGGVLCSPTSTNTVLCRPPAPPELRAPLPSSEISSAAPSLLLLLALRPAQPSAAVLLCCPIERRGR